MARKEDDWKEDLARALVSKLEDFLEAHALRQDSPEDMIRYIDQKEEFRDFLIKEIL